MRIGIDIMGGDNAPNVTIEGVVLALHELSPNVKLVLIGDSFIIKELLLEHGAKPEDFEIIHSSEVIGMGEQPTRAISQKTASSIAIGLRLLKDRKIDGFASAGNTGAMMVGAMYSVRAIEGIIRPCITSVIPKENGGIGVILDVGANVDSKPDVLYQFAILGSIYLEHVFKVRNPRVGLLNIGEEKEKGNLVTQSAYELMEDSKDFNFIGNIEGRDVLDEKADVIICDGFTGNIVLKQLESFYSILKKRNLLVDYFHRFNYENYGGTPILGINSTVVIGHGISNGKAIKNMILLTKDAIENKLSEKIKLAFQ